MSDDPFERRKEKARLLEEMGEDPWKSSPDIPSSIAEVVEDLSSVEEGDVTEEKYETAGRITAVREHGKSAFMDLKESNDTIQAYIKEDRVGEDAFRRFEHLDIGDIVRVRGEGGKTRTGEPTIFARSYSLLTKSLRPLPEKWHGLKDVEIRFRKRYLDLISNPEVMETFHQRFDLLSEVREWLTDQGYTEVETPMMHPIAGGAAATPFITHHNTLDMDLFLRIAPELYLKRLLVGGMPKIFEINRNFRNEGISPRHNPEFTMLELYEAHGNYETVLELTEELISHLAREVIGSETITYEGQEFSLEAPFEQATYKELFERHVGVSWENQEDVRERAASLDLPEKELSYGKLANELFEEHVEPELTGPVFVKDYPREISPFAVQSDADPDVTERFELFIAGMEVANAFTELTDPIEQRERLEEQVEAREEGYRELDEDFLTALEHGMPPAGGLGIGIDRLVMILTNADSIREVILFPQLRPRDDD